MKDSKKGILYALTTAFFWGFLPIALKVTVNDVDPFTIVWFRFTFAFSALFIYFILFDRKQLRILRKPPIKLIIASLALAINYIGFMLGIKYTSPSNAQIVIQIGPIIFALAGVLIFKEKLNRNQILGFFVVLGGFALFYNQQLKNLFVVPDDFNKGVLLILMAAFAWTTYAIMQKFLVKDYPPQTLNLFLFGLPAILYTPSVNFENFAGFNINTWLLLIFVGANTVIAYGSMTAAIKYLDANKVSTIIINNPIITFITMAILAFFNVSWIENEHFTILVWLGAALFICGAFIVVKGSKK